MHACMHAYLWHVDLHCWACCCIVYLHCWAPLFTSTPERLAFERIGERTRPHGQHTVQSREFSALEESRQCYLALIKACRLRGPAGEPGLRICASNLIITLISIAEGNARQQKTEEAETVFREALLVHCCLS